MGEIRRFYTAIKEEWRIYVWDTADESQLHENSTRAIKISRASAVKMLGITKVKELKEAKSGSYKEAEK